MTDSEKLDLLLMKVAGLDEKVTGLDEKVTRLEKDMIDVKDDLRRLHHDDALILDEVERVYEILLSHMNDTTKHTA
ncbi:MAG: hypothetical protein K2N80_03760 [Lachnospiraceae bacterium]|nr:hypothetical protein [Lachnospiraceae bacterium]